MGLDPRHPHELSHRDWTVLLCHPNGAIPGDDGCGLYHHDCRVLSGHRLTIDGAEPEWVSSDAVEADTWAATIRIARPGVSPEGPALPQDAIEVRLERRVGGGMLERIEVRNHGMQPRSVELAIEVTADFADVLEVAQGRRQQQGELSLQRDDDSVALRYSAAHGDRRSERGLRMRRVAGHLIIATAGSAALATASVELAPHGRWAADVAYEPLVDGLWQLPDGAGEVWKSARADHEAWRRRRPRLRSSSPTLQTAWESAAEDLYALRNRELEDVDAQGWVVNAGVPVFTGLFGRDVLTAGWQGAIIGPELMRGSLAITARLQATTDDPWLDAEPGKLIHEVRRGPFAELGVTAQAGYYGTQTTAAMFPLAMTELWHWTGNIEVLRQHRATAERALEWARRYGDLDGDGFLEYQQRSPVGIKNQAWKDSHEAIRYTDGGQVPNPIATVEEQSFHYLALVRMAEACVALEDDEAAAGYLERARGLRDAWHAAYWMPDEGFYAMALDAGKQQVRSIGSNPGHALAAGIVPLDHAERVADRLMAPDLFSGWGIRTLSDRHPSYNPWAYHLGTVWPVENATFALGFKRYGLDGHVDRLIRALLVAARGLPGTRLPELIGGQSTGELAFPVAYPQANCPQAWSASATLQLVQIMLGIYPFAPLRLLALVRPRLPLGIDEVTLHNLRVGSARISLRFRRRADGSASHEVLSRHGTLVVSEAPPPDAAGANLREAIAGLALAHAPGRLARAARLALGILE
ncbi:MAG: amylo-alpha-1,6-glucosidase [Candidatus Limnocylindria bacterium]